MARQPAPVPPPPAPVPLDAAWVADNPELHQNVKDALAAVPTYFRTATVISGIMAPDLFTLGAVLGAAIEDQTVATLNAMRQVWDPADNYALYSFIRQAQTFPDVLLRRSSDGHVLLGIELKGWYLLAREGEPSLRFLTTPLACSPQDLIAVVPWALSNVISGSLVVFPPTSNRPATRPSIAITGGNISGPYAGRGRAAWRSRRTPRLTRRSPTLSPIRRCRTREGTSDDSLGPGL